MLPSRLAEILDVERGVGRALADRPEVLNLALRVEQDDVSRIGLKTSCGRGRVAWTSREHDAGSPHVDFCRTRLIWRGGEGDSRRTHGQPPFIGGQREALGGVNDLYGKGGGRRDVIFWTALIV